MIKKLQRHGNSQALVLDKALLDAMGIDLETPLQITISGTSLVVTPVHVGLGRKRVAELINELRPKYKTMLENLSE